VGGGDWGDRNSPTLQNHNVYLTNKGWGPGVEKQWGVPREKMTAGGKPSGIEGWSEKPAVTEARWQKVKPKETGGPKPRKQSKESSGTKTPEQYNPYI